MRTSRLRGQDGLIREAFYILLVIGILAVVLLDAMALLNAHQGLADDTQAAADAARNAYAEAVSASAGKEAAAQSLNAAGATLVSVKAFRTADGVVAFTVTAKDHADTYAFKYLRVVPGLKKWTYKMLNPEATRTSE